MVDGGRASAGPPLGPALGPLGVNIGEVIAKINEKTKAYDGMKVPVKVIVEDDKSFEIKIGTPPMSALIKGELGIEMGAHNARTEKVGDLSIEQVKKIAGMKADGLLGNTLKARVMEVAGNCVSMGVYIDGKTAKAFQASVRAGEYDSVLAE